tara:strand:+ start:2284 stop:3114 length:831 start_codon:yes stop_codon:yes gene_type:complete
MTIYRQFRKNDVENIDQLFRKSMYSNFPNIFQSFFLFCKWLYKLYIGIILIDYLLDMRQFENINIVFISIYFLFHFGIIFFIIHYVHTTYPSKFVDFYNKKGNTIIVTEKNKKIIGFTSVCNNGNGNAWMTYLFVDPDYKRQGISKKLLSYFGIFAMINDYHTVKGGTSSIQRGQISFMKKYAYQMIPYHKYWFFPIHGYYIIWKLNYKIKNEVFDYGIQIVIDKHSLEDRLEKKYNLQIKNILQGIKTYQIGAVNGTQQIKDIYSKCNIKLPKYI